MKKLIFIISVFSLMNLAACTNTMEGVGKDLQKMGESITEGGKRLEKEFESKDDKEAKEEQEVKE